MTLNDMVRLWSTAKILHEARRDLAWGNTSVGKRRQPWPEYSSSYSHNPIGYVDLALAQAEALDKAGLLVSPVQPLT